MRGTGRKEGRKEQIKGEMKVRKKEKINPQTYTI
jgi:hypothetical protein